MNERRYRLFSRCHLHRRNLAGVLRNNWLDMVADVRNHGKKWTPEQTAFVIELYKQGVPYPQIAEAAGRSIESVKTWICKSDAAVPRSKAFYTKPKPDIAAIKIDAAYGDRRYQDIKFKVRAR